MPTLVTDPKIEQQLLERRRASRGDRFDEVWDGVYIMAPLANLEHQALRNQLTTAFTNALAGHSGTQVFPGVNVGDRRDDWEKQLQMP